MLGLRIFILSTDIPLSNSAHTVNLVVSLRGVNAHKGWVGECIVDWFNDLVAMVRSNFA